MTKINLNGKEIEFDRIVGYGCSFMAAAECLDHLINTDYSDLQKVNELKRKFKYDGSAIYNYLSSKKYCDAGKVDEKYIWEPGTVNYPFLFEEQKTKSWLQKLGSGGKKIGKLGVELVVITKLHSYLQKGETLQGLFH